MEKTTKQRRQTEMTKKTEQNGGDGVHGENVGNDSTEK